MKNGDISNEIRPAVAIDIDFLVEPIERKGLTKLAAFASQKWAKRKGRKCYPPAYRENDMGVLVLQRLERHVSVVLLAPDGYSGDSMVEAVDFTTASVARFDPDNLDGLIKEIYKHNIQWIYSNRISRTDPKVSGRIPVKPWSDLSHLTESLLTQGIVKSWANMIRFPQFGGDL